jgi:hypothetical protein
MPGLPLLYMCSGAGNGTRTRDPLLGKDRVRPKEGPFFIQYFKPNLAVFQKGETAAAPTNSCSHTL